MKTAETLLALLQHIQHTLYKKSDGHWYVSWGKTGLPPELVGIWPDEIVNELIAADKIRLVASQCPDCYGTRETIDSEAMRIEWKKTYLKKDAVHG